MVGLAPKAVRLAPNLGCAKCAEIWSEKAPDLSHLGPIWPTLEPNLPSLTSVHVDAGNGCFIDGHVPTNQRPLNSQFILWAAMIKHNHPVALSCAQQWSMTTNVGGNTRRLQSFRSFNELVCKTNVVINDWLNRYREMAVSGRTGWPVSGHGGLISGRFAVTNCSLLIASLLGFFSYNTAPLEILPQIKAHATSCNLLSHLSNSVSSHLM